MSETIRLQLQHLLDASDAEYNAAISSTSAEDVGISTAPISRVKETHYLHIEQLAALVKSAITTRTTEDLSDILHEQEQQRESEIHEICESSDNPLVDGIDQLALVHSRTREIRGTVAIVGQQVERSSTNLIEKVTRHVQMNKTRVNVEASLNIVRLCLQALEHMNQVQQLLKSNHRAAAVQNLQDLQSLELDELQHIGMGTLITQAIKSLSRDITGATQNSIGAYLESDDFRGHFQEVGSTSYKLVEAQRQSWKDIVARHRHLRSFRLNSPVELAYRRSRKNFLAETQLGVELGPLYEAEMVYQKLGIEDELVSHVKAKLSKVSNTLVVEDFQELLNLLPTTVGFCLFDRILSRHLPSVRPAKLVDDTWEKLAQNISSVVGKAAQNGIDLPELKLQLGTLMDVLQNYDFNMAIISGLLRTVFVQLTTRTVKETEAKFKAKWEVGDQMQMVATSQKGYESVLATVWYRPQDYEENYMEHGEVQLPKAFPFSEIYVTMCQQLKTLIGHGNSFLDHFQHDPGFVENTVAKAIDQLLQNPVNSTLLKVSKGHNREQIVQTMINLQLFHSACSEIEKSLAKMREATGRRGTVSLDAKALLLNSVKEMETRIHVILEESVREFFESNDFDWHATEPFESPSASVLEMTTYLLTMANTILKRLPPDVRSLAHFNLTENVGAGMRESLYSAPSGITPVAISNFDQDLSFLETSISQFSAAPSDALVEVRQTIDLLSAKDPTEEYNDIKIRNRKYGQIPISTASQLLRKIKLPETKPDSLSASPKVTGTSSFMRYLSGDKN